ncbi:MAG: hypothetical protein ACTSRI_14920 [Promethearchaeota archaeon]
MIVFKPRKIGSDNKIMTEKNAQYINELAGKCLKFKWIENQSKNLNRVLTPCGFCFDIKADGKNCSKCKILKIICDDEGNKGMVGYMQRKYGNIFLKDIDNEEYDLMRQSLMELSINGKISNLVKENIEKLIRQD